MTNKKNSEAPDLRQEAERIAKMRVRENDTRFSETDILKLLQELDVQQIELEMQMDELHRSYEELEFSQMRYAELYDLAPIGYFTINKKGRFSEVNLKFAGMLGMIRGELVNQEVTRFILIDDLDDFYHHQKQLFEEKTPQVCEFRMRNVQGNIFWARMNTTLISGSDGGTYCFVAVIDVTKEKLAEEELRRSEERYRLLVESSGIGIGFYSLEGKILYFNSKAIQNLGGRPEDYIGKSIHEVFGKEAGDLYLKRFRETANSEVSLEYEDFVPLQTGNYWFLSNHKKVLNSDGAIAGIQVIAQDITGRKQDELKINNQLEELQRWQLVTLGREERIMELKMEVNQLLSRLGSPVKYQSQENNQ